ncbi:hypothetical protein DESC_290074 [Desulfosarcina cetonica]|nr:hypothetical protein DESC_290074 [Desulfosarcina cetonica]
MPNPVITCQLQKDHQGIEGSCGHDRHHGVFPSHDSSENRSPWLNPLGGDGRIGDVDFEATYKK